MGSFVLVFYHERLLGAPWGRVTKPVVSPVTLVPLIMMMMMMIMTRNSADADKLHDAFSSQSRSPFDMLGMVSY